MKNSNPSLSAYMNYVSEEGIDLHRFVEHGGRLLGPHDSEGISANLADLHEKISDVRERHPLLARQLTFLASVFEIDPALVPETVRTETVFGLLYALKEMDLMPDDMPEVGYLDDAAVTEVVLSRHAVFFERYCEKHGLEWAALKPEICD